MANNYCQSSSFLDIPPEKIDRAGEIIEDALIAYQKLKAESEGTPDQWEDQFLSNDTELRRDGVLIKAWESFDPDECEFVVRRLVEELELDVVFVCSWAYICDKLRVDEFGGGAFAIARGRPTAWCDAMNNVLSQIKKMEEDEEE